MPGPAHLATRSKILTVGQAPPLANPPRQGGRSPLTDLFPTFQVVEAWFESITNTASISSGMGAIFGLQRLAILDNNSQEASLFNVQVDMLPADQAGTFGTDPIAWGNLRGTEAAIVIGKNLPMQPGRWSDWASPMPGLTNPSKGAAGAQHSGSRNPHAAVLLQVPFPTGKITDTTPQAKTIIKAWAPYVHRFITGDTLDIGLVIGNPASVLISNAKNLNGYALVQASIGLTENLTSWN